MLQLIGQSAITPSGSGYFGTLGIKGDLTMGSNGSIRDDNGNYNIDADGVSFATPAAGPSAINSLTWEAIAGDDPMIGVYSSNNDYIMNYQADAHFFDAGGTRILSVDDTHVDVRRPVSLPVYTNSNRPDPSTLPEGSMIYNTDDDRPQFVNNAGNWVGVSGN